VHFGEGKEQRGEALAAGDDAELGGLLDAVGGVQASVGQADDLGAGGLRLQEERRVIGARQRMAYRALDFAALGFDELASLLFQRVAEGVVGGEEIPAVATLGNQCAASADRQRMGVIGPVEAIG
jgi:hypothetical protein